MDCECNRSESFSQSNSTNVNKQNIIVTWLETNKTKAGSIPMIMVSDQDFWKFFGPLLKQSINGTTTSLSNSKSSKVSMSVQPLIPITIKT